MTGIDISFQCTGRINRKKTQRFGEYYARTSKDRERAQLLITHLINVAEMCHELAIPQLKKIAYLLGLLHDLGKYNPAWQEYLSGNEDRTTNHTFAGACIAGKAGLLQDPDVDKKEHWWGAAIIHGHHQGMLPLVIDKKNKNPKDTRDPFLRLKTALGCDLNAKNGDENYQSFLEQLEDELLEQGIKIDLNTEMIKLDDPRHMDIIVRMLFAILIHADRTDAQAFEENKPFTPTPRWNGVAKFPTHSIRSSCDEMKRDYGNAIAQAGSILKGIYRMYGITGIGKTEASLRFVVEHMKHHPELRGVVYVGPLKTVIGQTGRAYEEILGKENVLIHYCDQYSNTEDKKKKKYRESSETWDVNFIVTSCVQFFESYYHNYPRKCRKLANLANRIIIIDEAQLISNKFLGLCLDACEMLVKYFGCTVLLMSATHPHYGKIATGINGIPRDEYPDLCANNPQWRGLELRQQELVDNHVEYKYYPAKESSWEAIAQEINACRYKYSLTMLNTVATTEEGYQELSKLVPGRWVLITAKNCPRERQDLIEIMPWSPNQWGDGSLHAICTPLLGAGVHVNFPIGNIEITGIDSIFQFAGRINREYFRYLILGLKNMCRVNIFDMGSTVDSDRGYMIVQARKLLEAYGTINSKVIDEYYKALAVAKLDDQELIAKRDQGDFGYVAKYFRLIDDYKIPVLTQYKEGKRLVAFYSEMEEPLTISDWRSLQPYCGMYSEGDIKKGMTSGVIRQSPNGLYYLT